MTDFRGANMQAAEAQDRLSAKNAEIARLQSLLESQANALREISDQSWVAWEARAIAAEARLKEAEKDAERYRYLRERDLDTIGKGGVFAGMTPKNIILNLDDLDREVDAARAFLNAGEK